MGKFGEVIGAYLGELAGLWIIIAMGLNSGFFGLLSSAAILTATGYMGMLIGQRLIQK